MSTCVVKVGVQGFRVCITNYVLGSVPGVPHKSQGELKSDMLSSSESAGQYPLCTAKFVKSSVGNFHMALDSWSRVGFQIWFNYS